MTKCRYRHFSMLQRNLSAHCAGRQWDYKWCLQLLSFPVATNNISCPGKSKLFWWACQSDEWLPTKLLLLLVKIHCFPRVKCIQDMLIYHWGQHLTPSLPKKTIACWSQDTFYFFRSALLLNNSSITGCAATSRSVLRLMCDTHTQRTGCTWRTTPIYMWCKQAIIAWPWHVISIVTCCHSVKLCAFAAWAFGYQHSSAPSYQYNVATKWCCDQDVKVVVSDGFMHRPNRPWPRAPSNSFLYDDSILNIKNLRNCAEA